MGLMYAQAEDNYRQLERDTLTVIGRLSEAVGEEGYENDVRVRAFECVLRAKRALAQASPRLKRIAQGYADGLNLYLRTYPRPEHTVKRYEPWFFFAQLSVPDSVDGVRTVSGETTRFVDEGSNAWALAPSRTASGHPILFINPHVSLFGSGQRYECHLRSDEGWEISGFCILGNPIPHSGFTPHVGWTQTNTAADAADAYLERFDDPKRPLHYRYGRGYRRATEWTDEIGVLVGDKLERRKVRLRKTHHGPVVGRQGGQWVSVRVPLDRTARFWEQKLAMGRARNRREFERALAMRAMNYSNTTFATAKGDIGFWYGSAVARRDPRFDWSQPVDGSDPATEWRGYHELRELPHVVNPRAGFVQNGNSSPWLTSTTDNPVPAAFPSYIVRDVDTARARNMRRILTSQPRFRYDEVVKLAFDTYSPVAAERIPLMLAAAERNPGLKVRLAEPLEELRKWDHRGAVDSVAATLYYETESTMLSRGRGTGRNVAATPEELLGALGEVVDGLTRKWGTWRVKWGDINRLQRSRQYDPAQPSWAVAGAPGAFGQVFAFGTARPAEERVRLGTGGNSYVAVVEWGERLRAGSVCGFGQSADPGSPHYLDQAPLYAQGRLKPAWFYEIEVLSETDRSYHPGTPPRVED